MGKRAKRLMLIGLDAVSLRLLENVALETPLPHIQRLIAQGVSAEALACIPAYTPTNWATLATGAWPGTHGAGNWDDRVGTGPARMSTFDSRAIPCETIFEAAARQGLRTLSVTYPTAYPPRAETAMVVAPLYKGLLSLDMVHGAEYSCPPRPGAIPLQLAAAEGGSGSPPPGSLSAKIVVQGASGVTTGAVEDGAQAEASKERSAGLAFDLLIPAGSTREAWLCQGQDFTRRVARLPLGAWSEWVVRPVAADGAIQEGSMRFKLLRLSAAERQVRLVRSVVYPTRGFTVPEELGDELLRVAGPFFEHASVAGRLEPDLWHEVVFEEMEYQVDWYAKVAHHLLETRGWDLFYTHWHFPDTVLHHWLAQADPASPVYQPESAPEAKRILSRTCQIADRLIGGLMRCANQDTVTIVVADHGNTVNLWRANLGKRLHEAGLCVYERAPMGQPAWVPGPVMSKSKAYVYGGLQVNVNLRGRDPEGMVDPADYQAAQEAIIDALCDWREPSTGKRVVALALKKQDAQLIGYWGERCGDVIFVYSAGFAWGETSGSATVQQAEGGANHGPQIPTAGTALSNNLAVFLLAGPGLRRGYRWDAERLGYPRLVDVVPTLCHLLGIAPPRQCQGAVLWEALED